ncbi:MAG: beta-galactosidase trimerization domain-containing protein [Verrucomicrobia bacterium]|nr:beta-galactosidase trimerization domain-containing protein [Verrucomicrobiota bacterium]
MLSLPLRQLHMDFHCSEHIPAIGSKFDPDRFVNALKKASVNSVNLFAKCHHGWSYYDTKVGKRHPNLSFDLLRTQIEACKQAGISTVIYYSVGWDERAAFLHPDWREIAPDGAFRCWGGKNLEPAWKSMCLNSQYLDHACDQIRELAGAFPNADGFWLDIIHMNECCCSNCIRSMNASGLDWQNPEHRQKAAYARRERYFEAANAATRSQRRDMPVFHNSGHLPQGDRSLFRHFSHFEIESLPTGGWGYDHFPLSAAYARTIGKAYLGMTGKFHTMWGEFGGYKHPNALSHECSLMLAYGAGCSIGDQLHPTGEVDESTYTMIGHAYAEVANKEEWCTGTEPVADIALLSASSYLSPGRTDEAARDCPANQGAVRVLLESHFLFDVVDRYADFKKYKLLILPDLIRLDNELAQVIESYWKAGGRLLLTGASGLTRDAERFAIETGAEYEGISPYNPDYVLPVPELRPEFVNDPFVMYAPSHRVRATSGRSLGRVFESYFNRTAKHFCSHQHTPAKPESSGFDAGVASGRLIYLAHPVFSIYQSKGAITTKRYAARAIDMLLGEQRTIKTNLPSFGRITVTRQVAQARDIIHLLCAAPINRGVFHHRPIEVVEDLMIVPDVEVKFRSSRAIVRATLEPQGSELTITSSDQEISFSLHRLTGHQMIALHYA